MVFTPNYDQNQVIVDDSRNEMLVTSYFGYSGTNPMFTMFLKT